MTGRRCRVRAGHGAVVSMLILQFWGRWFDAPFMQSSDETLNLVGSIGYESEQFFFFFFFYLLLRQSISDHNLRSCGYVTSSRPQRTATGVLEPGTSRPKVLGFTTVPVRSFLKGVSQ